MQIFKLAKECGVPTGKMKQILTGMGVSFKSHLEKLDDKTVEAVRAKLKPEPPKEEVQIASQSPVEEIEKAVKQPEPITTVASSGNGEVIFFSTSRSHNIAYKREEYFGVTSKIKTPAKSIQFEEYGFRTSDPAEIEFIKAQKSFRVRSKDYPNGKVRIVTEDELARLRQDRMPRMTSTKVTDDKAISGVDMNRLNPVPSVI